MSFLQLTSTTCRMGTFVPKRFLHRTSDAFYMRHWQNIDFDAHTQGKLYDSGQLVTSILKVQSAMRQKGYFSFVHGAPPSSRILMRLYEVVYGKKQREFFHYLRPHNSDYMGGEKTGTLFMSYAISSGRKYESAAYFGFKKHNVAYYDMMGHFRTLVQETGVKLTPELEKKITGMILKSNRRQTGEFFVLGLKEKDVDRYVRDAKPVGQPTGKDAKSVSLFPERHMDTLEGNGAHLATLDLCAETLHASSEIVMVNPYDFSEVDSFCKGLSFKPFEEIPEYRRLSSGSGSGFEDYQLQKRAKIDQEMEHVAEQFEKLLKDPNTPISVELTEEDEIRSGDIHIMNEI